MPEKTIPRIAIVGAGNRGQAYGRWLRTHPKAAHLVAVADPNPTRRRRLAAETGGAEYVEWRELLETGPEIDAVIIATQDRHHVEPALAFLKAGRHVLLEKPIAPTEDECRAVVEAAVASGALFAVCHVLRYTPYTDLVKSVVDSGVLGAITGVQHLEPVGWWHAAHSYVRGPWRKEAESTPMLLAKSSHDLDWIRYVTGRRIERVASFGSRQHFRAEQRPDGAADRCLDCGLEPSCPYSAPRLYLGTLHRDGPVWPVTAITDATDEAGVIDALRTGPFGRCVYASDNDVVDQQVIAMELDGGASGTFTMTAFSEQAPRQTRLFGSHGTLEGDGERVRVVDFRDGSVRELVADGPHGSNAADGHGGGDDGVMSAFTRAVSTGDADAIRSGPLESLESHLAVFAAEEARHSGAVITVPSI
ncbi:Gfo/Idh/MocA family protein [Phytoactinopolyspora halotolerans]|uniref:Gfo/Idh/MocA family oxidoreductase n=1 Tax=Phytoactinopolyspora halotolerans TaxID=1981512 RepID=A0A6L9S8K8_9ACTN|nr:Gfo/Idh/MocA family oxidoreductase [Phytoactinopolyspora halotolerans]NEE01399.1 Gfo/Idh/MocA family oxidoreductase [Phytoactinopolyspora halotolerans]